MYHDNLEYILDEVCKTLRVSKEDVLSRNRKAHLIDARIVYAALACSRTRETLTTIGSHINRDHSMVIHYRNKHEIYAKTDKTYKNKYDLCLYVAASVPTGKDTHCLLDRLMKRNAVLMERYRFEKTKREDLEIKLLRLKSGANASQ
tara:strand:- start:1243 stop:1683 length:441 start_codon:yes stop_codon:yes gene_type:complete